MNDTEQFVVVGWAIAFADGTKGSKPYVGPIRPTKEEAISAWLELVKSWTGTPQEEVERVAKELSEKPIDELVSLYGGDEYVIVLKLPVL